MSGSRHMILGFVAVLLTVAAALVGVYSFFIYLLSFSCWDGPQVGGCGHLISLAVVAPILALVICVVAGMTAYKLLQKAMAENKAEYYRARAASGWSDDTSD